MVPFTRRDWSRTLRVGSLPQRQMREAGEVNSEARGVQQATPLASENQRVGLKA